MTRPPYNLGDGEVWTVGYEDGATYHVTKCAAVVSAHTALALHVWEVRGPETLADMSMCTECAHELGHDAWPRR